MWENTSTTNIEHNLAIPLEDEKRALVLALAAELRDSLLTLLGCTEAERTLLIHVVGPYLSRYDTVVLYVVQSYFWANVIGATLEQVPLFLVSFNNCE